MPRNSSGTYSLPAGNPVVANTLIQTTWANPTMSDLGASITDSLDRNGRGAMLAPLKGTDGSATSPAFTFSSEGTLGMFRVSAGVLGFAAGGVLALSLSSSGLIFTNPLVIPLGTVAAPSLSFVGNTNTGIYSPGTNQVSISAGGVDRLAVNAAGVVTLSDGAIVLGAAGSNFVTAVNAAGTLLFQTGGANTRLTIDAAGVSTFANSVVLSSGATLPNGIALVWRDAGGTGRAMAQLSGTVFQVGDIFDAIAGSTVNVRADSGITLQIGPTTIANVSPNGVGIGVVPSAWGASSHAVQLGTAAALNGVGLNTVLSNNLYNSGAANVYIGTGFATSLTMTNAGTFFFQGAPSGTAGGTVTLSTLMQLTASGLLGIGMTPASNKLEIAGSASTLVAGALDTSFSANVSGVLAAAIGCNNTATTNGIGAVAGANYIGTVGGPLVFTTSAVEHLRLDTAGAITATGTITAAGFIGPLTGNVTGNASGSSGSTTGNAATATALQTARTIGGVSFNGTAHIVPTTVAAGATDGTFELGWKDIPQNAQAAAYTLVLADRGKSVTITTGGVTVPAGIFSAGAVVTITNNSAAAQTITQGASVTLHQAGTATTGNRTLAPWGVCSVMCTASNVFIATGNIS